MHPTDSPTDSQLRYYHPVDEARGDGYEGASTTWNAAELVEKARKAAKKSRRDAEAARMDQLTLLSLTHRLHSLLTKKFEITDDALDTWLIPVEREMLNKLLELHSDYSKRSGA